MAPSPQPWPVVGARLMLEDAVAPDPCEWQDLMRLHVTVDGPIAGFPPIDATHSAMRPQVAITHGDFAGVWTVDRVVGSTVVCQVRAYNGDAFTPCAFELELGTYGSALTIVPRGTAKGAPRVAVAPALVMHVRSTIFMLDAIDTVAQAFKADVFVEVRLRRVSLRPSEDDVLELMAQFEMRPGLIDFMNVSEYQTEPERWTSLGLSTGGGGTFDFSMKMRAKGTFTEQYELAHFPFDVQDVHAVVTVQCPRSRVELVANAEYPSRFLSRSFQLGAVFELLHGSDVDAEVSLSHPDESSARIVYPRCSFSITLQRRYGYFLTNIIMPVGIITLVAPLSAATEPDGQRMGTGDRLAYALTLLLTAVAYKFAIAGSIPQVSYLSLIDSYTLTCFAFMWLNLLEAAAWPSIGYVAGPDGEPVERFDEWAYAAAFVGTFVLYNAHFFWRVRRVLYGQRASLAPAVRAAPLALAVRAGQ
ncbi:hypothetical protein KFE25_002065 [Diacronema lutheri]|uniref:Neurotransmitter-gated ion-channel ligand-binding domain-containing protein n=1 Tax=Diacronema lutheri TaxID=2081491 RepID=A0A8J5XTL2_DIALT|nr:hypothetical protein KFE25_002065 [Diacronema lutheri]